MKKILMTGFAVLALTVAASAHACPSSLFTKWYALNEACRGGHGDDPKTDEACRIRQQVSHAIYARGYCYGKEGQGGSQMEWHRCTPTSLR
jgi:hypothetical protein